MPSFKHNMNEVHYGVRGDGRALLFMHGLGADKSQAEQALESLSNFRLIIVDMPGHGKSELSRKSTLEEQVGFRVYGELAVALMQHLAIPHAIVGGISMGAGIALHMAISQPKLVDAMLLVRPAWLDRPGRPHLGIMDEIGNWIAEKGQDAAARKLSKHPVYASAMIDNQACAASILSAIYRSQASEAAAVLSAMVGDQPISSMSSLHKCQIPTLIVGNNADPLHPPMIAREISGALADARYFHAPPKYLEPLEHKSAVIESIEQFLNERLPATNIVTAQ